MTKQNESGWGVVIFVAILILLAYNYTTSQKIENNYGYEVETRGITSQPDCDSLSPQNPYSYGTGHYAGYEWGSSGKGCGGNSGSFIDGCMEYQNQEDAYKYCLSR